jgi:hypothetical protein
MNRWYECRWNDRYCGTDCAVVSDVPSAGFCFTVPNVKCEVVPVHFGEDVWESRVIVPFILDVGAWFNWVFLKRKCLLPYLHNIASTCIYNECNNRSGLAKVFQVSCYNCLQISKKLDSCFIRRLKCSARCHALAQWQPSRRPYDKYPVNTSHSFDLYKKFHCSVIW